MVDTDVEHMKLYLKLLRETPFGLSEAPLISDEALYNDLLDKKEHNECLPRIRNNSRLSI